MTRSEKIERVSTLQNESKDLVRQILYLKDLMRQISYLKDLDKMKRIVNSNLNDVISRVDEIDNIIRTIKLTIGLKIRYRIYRTLMMLFIWSQR